MPNPKLMQVRDGVVSKIAALSSAYGLTIASGSCFAGHPTSRDLPPVPAVGVMIGGYSSEHASYSGPTIDATAEIVVFMVTDSDDDLIRLAADVQNAVTAKAGDGTMLGLSFIVEVMPGEWEPRNPTDELVSSGKFFGELHFDVDFYYDRGSA